VRLQMISTQKIGEKTIGAWTHTVGVFGLLWIAALHLRALHIAPVRQVLYRQIYFSGIEALSKVTLIAALIGIVIITQVSNFVGLHSPLVQRMLVWTTIREMGPLISAIFIIARSSTAVTSELAAMKVSGEIGALRSMGIDPLGYLIMPRVLGVTVSVFFLTFYFQFAAIFGGLALSSVLLDTPLIQHFKNVFEALSFGEVGVSAVKALIFGLLISATSCYHGQRVQHSITEIPQTTTAAVMQSLFFIFIFDGLITVVSFL